MCLIFFFFSLHIYRNVCVFKLRNRVFSIFCFVCWRLHRKKKKTALWSCLSRGSVDLFLESHQNYTWSVLDVTRAALLSSDGFTRLRTTTASYPSPGLCPNSKPLSGPFLLSRPDLITPRKEHHPVLCASVLQNSNLSDACDFSQPFFFMYWYP